MIDENVGFEAEWLIARGPYDEAALDPVAVDAIECWAVRHQTAGAPVVVDLGSGTGAALRRARRWLAPREIVAYAVDRDPALLERAIRLSPVASTVPIVGDLLVPLERLGGPPDGTVDLIVSHALADLVPLDQLAVRVAALLRPGGLAHLALTYDGLTAFMPTVDPDFERSLMAAFHRHMDRPALVTPSYGGSTAGRRLGRALADAGLKVLTDALSVWQVRADDGHRGRQVLARLLRFVIEAVREMGDFSALDLDCWAKARHEALAAGSLSAMVGHRDVLAAAPGATQAVYP